MKKGFSFGLAAVAQLLAGQAQSKQVFCHYLVGIVYSDHASADIDAAQALGFDAFALDILDPTAEYTSDTTSELFSYAQSTGFKLFFSMDLGAYPDLDTFQSFVQPYLSNSAYYTYNDLPFLSTYSAADYGPSNFTSFLSSLGQSVYFVPDADNAAGYYSDPGTWNYFWDPVIQGAFSWETAWPVDDSGAPVNESNSQDLAVQSSLLDNGKTYMMPLSTLQYKHLVDEDACSGSDENYYRIGEVNMPQRMTDILSMQTAPDFVEVITWNDAGESHYIGNIWPEGNFPCVQAYSNQTYWDHSGWQPIFESFIAAYKSGVQASGMAPPSSAGAGGVGAMWYHTLLKSATCAGDPLGKPSGWQGAQDAVNFAVVLPSSASSDGTQIRVTSGGQVLTTIDGVAGLNYASVGGLQTGSQLLEVLDSQSNVLMTTASQTGLDVQSDTDGICNFNYQVLGLASS